jgi:hypothetical protein
MSKKFDDFIGGCVKAIADGKSALPADFAAAARILGDKVEKWGMENHLMTPHSLPRGGKFFAATESLGTDQIDTAISAQCVADLVADSGVPKCYQEAATARVAAILCQVVGKNGQIAFTDYNTNDTEVRGEIRSLESLYGPALWQAVAPATEAFGLQMDRVTPDLKTILTVALLQFHVALTPRVVPIQSVTQSNIQITREMMEVFDMSQPDQKPTRIIELYRDPDMVDNRAVRIEPLVANDAGHAFLVEDGIYKLEEELNLFKLALITDGSKPGWEKFNHTDIIEDGIVVDGLLVKLTTGAGTGSAKSETFVLEIPKDKARLTQVPNDYRSTERRLQLDRTTIPLNASTKRHDSDQPSEILAAYTAASGKYLALRINLNASVDRKTGNAKASCWGKAAIRTLNSNVALDAADTTFINGLEVEYLGVKIDARYNEDNKRKTSIRVEINRRNMSYELPAGRNFVMDFAIGQEGATNAATRLAQVECIGRDGKILKVISETLQYVHNIRWDMGNSEEVNAEIAATYAAGDLVNQTAYTGTIDFGTGFLAIRSADATGDIKQFLAVRLNKIITGLNACSLIEKQLAQGTPVTYRVITSPYLLGTILACHHIHAHLDQNSQAGNGATEYVLKLDCGARLEVVTTTFKNMYDKMVIIPFFEDSPTSMFNFGTDFDQGTLVGAITLGADNSAAHNRMFSTTREALIPTNVVGAVLTITGLGDPRVAMDFPSMTEA